MAKDIERVHPLLALGDGDREFVLRFVLASGSLKEVAQAYGVSYPTIRAKLDRLIGQLNDMVAGRMADPMAELLADFVAKGEMAPSAARKVLNLHREAQRNKEA